MGLLTRLVLLPLAPVEGVAWVARQIEEQAMRQYFSPEAIRAQLAELHEEAEAGTMSEEEFAQQEAELLDRLDEALEMQSDSASESEGEWQ